MLHGLEGKTNETISNASATSKKQDELKEQLGVVNNTLTGKVEALQTKIELFNVSNKNT
jgi:hypothetical protein